MWFLIKKEFRDFLHSYKSILIVMLSISVPILYLQFKKESLPTILFFLFVQMSVSQFIYDSCNNDKENGGNLVIINHGYNFFEYLFSKLIFAFIITLIILLSSIPFVFKTFHLLDYFLLIFSVIYSCFLMFIGNAISRGEELATATILTIIMIFFLYITFLIPYNFLKILFSFFITSLLGVIGYKIYNSLSFRSYISN